MTGFLFTGKVVCRLEDHCHSNTANTTAGIGDDYWWRFNFCDGIVTVEMPLWYYCDVSDPITIELW